MRFVLAFNGTRGDIQPAVVLGAELKQRGHDVVFGAPPNLVDFAIRAGLDARPFGYDTRAHMNSELIRDGMRTGGPLKRLRALAEIRDHGWNEMVDEMFDLCEGADAIVTGFTTQQIAFAFAQRDSIPLFALHHAPVTENPHVSPFPGASLTVPSRVNTAAWELVDTAFWWLTRGRENRLRQRLGIASATKSLPQRMADYGAVEIQAYDPIFCPDLPSVWGDRRPLVGFLGLPEELRSRIGIDGLDLETDNWIDEGTPPIYFGFGSMPVRDSGALLGAIDEACEALGERALVCAGWNDFDQIASERLRVVGAVDHDRTFGRCRGIVHHGGAGTTSAAIRAGKPALVCWVGSDQPFWGHQLERLGVGSSTRLKGLGSAGLTEKLRGLLGETPSRKARELASRLIASEQAISTAADLIEGAAPDHHLPRLSA